MSINIDLVPSKKWLTKNKKSINDLTDEYAGYYLNVSYSHYISNNTVYSKDRVEVEEVSLFRFFTPKADYIVNKEIKIEIKAPNGEIVYSKTASVNLFNPSSNQKNKKDESKPFEIEIDPINLNDISSSTRIIPKTLKLNGRVIDISNTQKVSNIQVIVWATISKEENVVFNSDNFKPIFVGNTDKEGYFSGNYVTDKYQYAFATLANSNDNTVKIEIEKSNSEFFSLKSPVLIALDFQELEIDAEDCSCNSNTPFLPDSKDLIESGVYSQDLGGQCINFTTPNRTLEEFVFYHAVRTTEPEIKGLSLNVKDVKLIRKKLIATHNKFREKVNKFKKSVLTIERKTDIEIEQMYSAKAVVADIEKTKVDKEIIKVDESKTSKVVPKGDIPQKSLIYNDIKFQYSTATTNHDYASTKLDIYDVRAVEARPAMVTTQIKTLKTNLSNAVEAVEDFQKQIEEYEKQIGKNISTEEIYTYRELYISLKKSIDTFIDLLEDYNNLYSSFKKILLISDVYFVNNYSSLKNAFQEYLKEIDFRIEEIEKTYISNHPGRNNVSVENPIDWDDEPTIYQNTTIAHGHLLCFKQQWKAAGYSLGNLLNSLPLAPLQKKQIAVFDWNREETGSRSEIQANEEKLTAQLIRDRAIGEMMNSSLNQSSKGSSSYSGKSSSSSIGASISLPISPSVLVGVSGGHSSNKASAQSSASQNSSRNLSSSASNNLRDSVQQSATSLRSQRSTVIQTVGQGESFNVTTEVVANHNACHFLTMQYFEVLRHTIIEQNLVEVSECLFVPMQMSVFNIDKILRWKNNLKRHLFDRSLVRGFDALERIKDNYKNSELININGIYADETIEDYSGNLRISFEFERPYITAIEEAEKEEEYIKRYRLKYKTWFGWISGGLISRIRKRFVPINEAEKDKIFEEEFAPDLAREFIDNLSLDAIDKNGNPFSLDADFTMVSKYRKGLPLYITVNPRSIPNLRRSDIKRVILKSNSQVESMSKIILRSCSINYETTHISNFLVNSLRMNNDIINKDAALFYTPLNSNEKVNPKNEDYRLANNLIEHFNEHLEYYHRMLWTFMDNGRLFNLLDGFIAPNSQGRSVSSVVENSLIGVVGNNLVLKVAPGYNLDPTFRISEGFDLLEHYQPLTPPDPFRISVPTRGVYGEAVMGECNSCEYIDESRFWRFNEGPSVDEPTAINPISTDSRRSDPGNLQAKNMETPVINIQNAPSAPDPTGLGAALNLMGKSDIFKDITGLDGTQKSALAQLVQSSSDLNKSQDLASHALDKAVEMEQQKRALQSAHTMRENINKDFKSNPEEKEKYLKKLYDQQLGIQKNSKPKLTDNESIQNRIKGSDSFKYSNGDESIEFSDSAVNDKKDEISDLIKILNDTDFEHYSLKNDIKTIINDPELVLPTSYLSPTNLVSMIFAGNDSRGVGSLGYSLLENIISIKNAFSSSNNETIFIGLIELGSIEKLDHPGIYLFEITNEGIKILEKWDSKNNNIGNEKVIINFMSRLHITFDDTENKILGLSSHGSSYNSLDYVLLSGDNEPENILSSIEFKSILNDLKAESDFEKFSIIFTDSCTNGNVEKLFELNEFCDFYIGSEMLVEGVGYDYYNFMNSLLISEEFDSEEFAKEILASFYNFYSNDKRKGIDTLALFDTSESNTFSSKIKTFSDNVIALDENDFKKAFKKARRKSHDLVKLDNYGKDDGYDLYEFLSKLKVQINNYTPLSSLNSDIDDIINFLEPGSGIISDCVIPDNKKFDFRGLGIWIPRSKRKLEYNKSRYQSYEFDKKSNWSKLLEYIYTKN
ncbi:clostripain-related cysteine peptidase [Tenacibaculum sp. 1_MG-2023]|uniref:clostripain-related cysteine peptidase n=1 Tax=Tenacibaculum sp. 1_MG-2023 TaxID=3062653 RepID=UPI0026E2616A|nr:clostripain-related cysteine peptidase [Tenacibaculum sp. 1_MG-2023]